MLGEVTFWSWIYSTGKYSKVKFSPIVYFCPIWLILHSIMYFFFLHRFHFPHHLFHFRYKSAFLTYTQTHAHAHPPLPGSLLLWSFTYDDAWPTWDVLPLIYYLCSILSLKLCSWSVTLPWHFCIAEIPTSFFSEILLHSQLVPYSLTHHCSPMLALAGLTEDASALLESELSRKLWNQMFLTFTGRRDSPDYMQWVKGSSKLATNVISHLERSRQPLSWKRTRVHAAETPNRSDARMTS